MATSRVSRTSISEQVANLVRNMILVGELPPGQKITHEELARRLEVSTMPVREALLRLSYEGFIEARPGKSFRVGALTKGDITDVYWIHGQLAGELTARAAATADDELVERLRTIQAAWTDLPAAPSPESLDELNRSFHRTINKAARSPKLTMMLGNTLRLIPEHFYWVLPAWSETAVPGHEEIVEAIADRDAERARDAAQRHVRDAGNVLLEYFDDLGYWNRPQPG